MGLRTNDIVHYLLASLPGESITSNDAKIHPAFYKLKQDYPNYFESYLFDINGPVPHCKNLFQDVFTLVLTGCLNRQYNDYFMSKEHKKIVLKDEKFSEHKEALQKMSSILEDLLK
jgi:hypothetical protein